MDMEKAILNDAYIIVQHTLNEPDRQAILYLRVTNS